MDVRVHESGHQQAAAEIHHLGPWTSQLTQVRVDRDDAAGPDSHGQPRTMPAAVEHRTVDEQGVHRPTSLDSADFALNAGFNNRLRHDIACDRTKSLAS